MGTITAQQLLDRTRGQLGEQVDENGDYPQSVWTDQFLLDGVNMGIRRLARDQFWFFVKLDTSLTTVASQAAYTLPTGIEKILSIHLGAVSAGNEVVPISTFDFDNIIGGSAYKIENNGTTSKIYLDPAPTTAGTTIRIKGISTQTELTTDGLSGVTAIPDRYSDFLMWTSVANAHSRENEGELEDRAQAKADDIYMDIWVNELAPGGQEKLRMKHPSQNLT